MKHFMVITFVLILTGAQSCFSGQMPQRMRQVVDTCFAKVDVPEDEQKRLLDAKLVLDDDKPTTHCFIKCFMEEWGAIKDGALDEEAVMQLFAPIFGDEKAADMLDQCKGEQGDAECETEFKIFTCFYSQRPQNV